MKDPDDYGLADLLVLGYMLGLLIGVVILIILFVASRF